MAIQGSGSATMIALSTPGLAIGFPRLSQASTATSRISAPAPTMILNESQERNTGGRSEAGKSLSPLTVAPLS